MLISLIVFWSLGLLLGFFWLILLFVSVVFMIASPFAKQLSADIYITGDYDTWCDVTPIIKGSIVFLYAIEDVNT